MQSLLKSITTPADKVHLVRYADDFVITGSSKERGKTSSNRRQQASSAKSSIKSFLDVIRKEIKTGIALPTASLIAQLNRKITGRVNYYRYVVAKAIFSKIDTAIFWAIYRITRRKNSNKSKG